MTLSFGMSTELTKVSKLVLRTMLVATQRRPTATRVKRGASQGCSLRARLNLLLFESQKFLIANGMQKLMSSALKRYERSIPGSNWGCRKH